MNKNYHIETLRGIAIILVVTYHAHFALGYDGSQIWLGQFFVPFQFLRMPLFTFISGFVYAIKPIENGKINKFLRGKTRRLLFPLFTIGTITYILDYASKGDSQWMNFYISFFFTYNYFWYIQAIFLIFLSLIPIESLKLINTKKHLIFLIIITSLISAFFLNFRLEIDGEIITNDGEGIVSLYTFFSWRGALIILPYFFLGILVKRFELVSYCKKNLLLLSIPFILGIIWQELQLFGIINGELDQFPILRVFVSCISCLFLIGLYPRSRFLAIFGSFAYPIYLLHDFAHQGVTRVIFIGGIFINSLNTGCIFLLKIALGLLVPIVILKLLDRNRISRLLFFGRIKKLGNK